MINIHAGDKIHLYMDKVWGIDVSNFPGENILCKKLAGKMAMLAILARHLASNLAILQDLENLATLQDLENLTGNMFLKITDRLTSYSVKVHSTTMYCV